MLRCVAISLQCVVLCHAVLCCVVLCCPVVCCVIVSYWIALLSSVCGSVRNLLVLYELTHVSNNYFPQIWVQANIDALKTNLYHY